MVSGRPAENEDAPRLPSALRRRVLATLLDLRIILLWIAFTTALGPLLHALQLAPSSPEGWDAYAFMTLVLPTALTFALAEASPRQATWGKRRQRLAVVDRRGARLSLGRSLLRQAAKFGPWQMAHTAVFHLVDGHTSPLLWVLSLGAQLLVLISAVLLVLRSPGRPLHDLIAQTRVVDRIAERGGA